MILSRAQRKRIRDIASGRSEEPLHVLEGPKAIADALRLGAVAEVWVRNDPDASAVAELVRAAEASGVPVGRGARADFERLTDTVTPQGVLALVRDTAASLEDVVRAPGLLVWLDGVQDPGNVGAVVRVAAAFGVAGLLVGAGSADPLGLKALRASVGLALGVPFARAEGAEIARALGAAGRPVWALDPDGRSLFDLERVPANVVLAVGAEGSGIGPAVEAAADARVGIPLAPGVDSLNAAVAAGIAVALLRRHVASGGAA